MNVQEALPFADEVVFAKTGKHLDDMQLGVIEGVLKWQKYGDIAQGLNCTEGDAKDVGYEVLEIVPSTMETVSEIQPAFAIANETNLNPEKLADLEEREMFILDQQGVLLKGIEKGIAQGREQGIAEGRKEGPEEGLALGMREKTLEIARQLLNVLDNQTISQTTGLSVEDIQNLREE